MAGKLPRDAKLFTDSLRWLDDMLKLFSSEVVTVPTDYRNQVIEVKTTLNNDCSGLVSSLLDFAINCSNVSYIIETTNTTLYKFFQDWLNNINSSLRGKIPVGINALAKEYFRERWKGSSFLLLRTVWEEKDGLKIPTQLAFVDGEDIVITTSDDKMIKLGDEKYALRSDDKKKPKPLPENNNEKIFIQKPYESWSTNYPTPFIIKRGIFRNLKLMELLHTKGERFVSKALEYILLMKKGTEALTLSNNPDFTYGKDDYKTIKQEFQEQVDNSKQLPGVSAYLTSFDTQLEHIIPDYGKIINENLYAPIERKLLAGMGLVEIIQGIASARRESILNPKPFIAEVRNAIEDFSVLLTDIMQTILDENKEMHRKYAKEEFTIHHTPVKDFITNELLVHLRSAYDRGVISKRTYCEIVSESDFDVEEDRRKTETKTKADIFMYPPVIDNREGIGIDIPGDEPTEPKLKNIKPRSIQKKKVIVQSPQNTNIPPDKLGPEAKNYNLSIEEDEDTGEIEISFSPEVTQNYIRLRQIEPNEFEKDSFRIIVLSKSKGIKAVIGKLKGHTSTTIQSYLFEKNKWTVKEAENWVHDHRGAIEEDPEFEEAFIDFAIIFEEAPYKTNNDLPPAVKKYPSGAQTAFREAFNNALNTYGDETTAFKISWSVLKKWMAKHKG